jgi:glycogen operon protein
LGLHLPPGTPAGADGVAQAAVFAPHATGVQVCLYDGADGDPLTGERRVRLPDYVHGIYHGPVPGVRAGQRYGLRVEGPWEPANGLRFNPAKLLLDPYAQAISGGIAWGQAVFGHAVDRWGFPVDGPGDQGGAHVLDHTDSAGSVPLGVVLGPVPAPSVPGPGVPFSRTVVYEAHLKGLTIRHPEVPQGHRGTWAGLAHPAVLDYLVGLGVTSIELLPVFASLDEASLVRRRVSNYWRYNHLSFFAPEPSYVTEEARRAGPEAVCAEVVAAVDAVHAAGLEVLLDVVYNHTCEGGVDGPMLSWRGLGEADYYRVDSGGRYLDMTGCGNTLNFSQPVVYGMALDSLRHWVTAYGVDGFRFDLAPALARGDHRLGRDGYDPNRPFLAALRCDPVLSTTKLIAEPWDIGPGGWRTGEFPPPFAEWNDRYRDGIRSFWLADAAAAHHDPPAPARTDLRDLATRMAGSSDRFSVAASVDRVLRPAWASVNFVTAHDGFTLTDLVSYARKHNDANGEFNRDGSDNNLSWNHGVEGPTVDPKVVHARHRTRLAILATLVLSIGTPMLTAGDEMARSQGGNNHAYCQDNEISWLDWQPLRQNDHPDHPIVAGTFEAVRELLALRAAFPALTTLRRPDGRHVGPAGAMDIGWFGADGTAMDYERWHDSSIRTLQLALHGAPTKSHSMLIVVQGAPHSTKVALPGWPWSTMWTQVWDSAAAAQRAWQPPTEPAARVEIPGGTAVKIRSCTVRVYRGETDE